MLGPNYQNRVTYRRCNQCLSSLLGFPFMFLSRGGQSIKGQESSAYFSRSFFYKTSKWIGPFINHLLLMNTVLSFQSN